MGDNAINQSMPEWGPYEYSHILDSLRKRGFHVISEIRKEGVDDSLYTNKLVKQIDSLLHAGARAKNPLIIGASAGWNITLHVAAKLKNKRMKYVMMGGCWPDTYTGYRELHLSGNFLSIIETTDPHGTCNRLFEVVVHEFLEEITHLLSWRQKLQGSRRQQSGLQAAPDTNTRCVLEIQ